LALIGGGALITGSLLPWAKISAPIVGTLTKSGVEGGDGWFSLGAGVVVVLLGVVLLTAGSRRGIGPVLFVIALAAAALVVFEWRDITRGFHRALAGMDATAGPSPILSKPSSLVVMSKGAGLYVLGAGALFVLLASTQTRSS
jgi:hypothetical protein